MEANILLFLQNNVRGPILDSVLLFITRMNNGGMIWIALILILLIFKKTRKTGIYCIVALVIDVVLVNFLIKPLVGRIRPYDVIDGLICMVGPQKDASFPSGHTASSFAVAFAAFLRGPKKIGIPALVVAALIGFSRLYVGVHYPTDVLAGIGFGLLCGFLAVFIMDRVFAWFDKRKQEKAAE